MNFDSLMLAVYRNHLANIQINFLLTLGLLIRVRLFFLNPLAKTQTSFN